MTVSGNRAKELRAEISQKKKLVSAIDKFLAVDPAETGGEGDRVARQRLNTEIEAAYLELEELNATAFEGRSSDLPNVGRSTDRSLYQKDCSMTVSVERKRVTELRAQTKLIGDQMKGLSAKFEQNGKRWANDADRQEFEKLNTERRALVEELETELDKPMDHPYGIPGREDTRSRRPIGGDDYDQRQLDADMALAAWTRHIHGEPVPQSEVEAAHRCGISPFGSGFVIDLTNTRPTIGRNLRFAQPGVDYRSLNTMSIEAGGSTVPTGFVPRLERSMKAFGPMLVTSELMITDHGHEMPWPTLNDVDNEGVQIGEEQLSEDSDMTFGATILRSYKFSSQVIKVSHELLRDNAVNLATAIGDALGERLGRIVNRRATTGAGNSTLSGIVTGSAAGKTTASATAITFDELIELQGSIDPAYRFSPGVGWMMHSDVASYVQRIKDGNANYIWQQPTQGILAGQPPMLLGAPVYINQNMDSTVASGKKTILFGDLSKYKMRVVGRIRLRQLNERYAEYDQVGFLAFFECDGVLLNPSGAATLCPVKHLLQA